MKRPMNQQIGGTHYKALPIQPVEYCQRNGLGFCESSVVKYVSRHRGKGGAEDIKKAIHFLNLLLEIEYPAESVNAGKPNAPTPGTGPGQLESRLNTQQTRDTKEVSKIGDSASAGSPPKSQRKVLGRGIKLCECGRLPAFKDNVIGDVYLECACGIRSDQSGSETEGEAIRRWNSLW